MQKRILSTISILLLLTGFLATTLRTQQVEAESTTILNDMPKIESAETASGLEIATTSTIVSIDPENITAHSGEVFTISVKIFDVRNLYGVDIQLTWDSNIIRYVNHTVTMPVEYNPNGVLHSPGMMVRNIINETGIMNAEPESKYWVAYCSMLPAPLFNGSGMVFSMTFEALRVGSCSINFTNAILSEWRGIEITRAAKNGHVDVVSFEHDLGVSLLAPIHSLVNTLTNLSISLDNVGFQTETDVRLELFIDEDLKESITINSFDAGTTYSHDYSLILAPEGSHNITVYVEPVDGETNLLNNFVRKKILIGLIQVPLHFGTIDEAINAAAPGATISVAAGIYYTSLIVNKPLTLVGEGNHNTIIDGQGEAYAIAVNANDVTITGFTIKHSCEFGIIIGFGRFDTITMDVSVSNNSISDIKPKIANQDFSVAAGIYLAACDFCRITSNIIEDTKTAIYTEYDCNNDTFGFNTISNASLGILVRGQTHKAESNTISNGIIGILSQAVWSSSISMNIIRNQSDAAIKLDYASFNTISANRIWSCRTGIQLMGGSTYNNIQANQISYGQCGMGLSAFSSDLVYYDTACNVIIQNTIFKNACGMTLDNSKSNTIFENKFIQNAVQISLHESFDIWHDEKNEGNYWSDYSGRDLNDDGIGDTQLPHQGVDNYPLMKPCLNTTVDVNTDGKVNIQDIVVLSSIYGCRPDDPRWNWNADIAFPYGVIDILDLVVCAAHYGELTPKS